MPHLLIVTDGLLHCELLTQVLNQAGYRVDCVCDAESALDYQHRLPADLVILDVSLINLSTLQLVADICERFATPTLLLSSSSKQQDMIDALQAGADKFLVKPYAKQTLLIYITALLRRVALEKQRLAFHHCSQQFSLKMSRLPLTETETLLMQYLSKNNDITVSKAVLQKEVLKKDLCADDRNLDMHISNIRRKMLGSGLSKLHIKTVHGKGYIFSESIT